MWIDHAGQTVVCRQVVGILARRIVCRVPAGAEVRTGDRFGVMKFGSRIDLFLPPTATIAVKVGDRVESGLTVVARLAEAKG
jgi:phosphatidylserine decarboxylase